MGQNIHAEVVVIGAGPGGYAAAFRAADLGKKVLLIDKDADLGGVCLNRGCIPSKALLHIAKVIEEAKALEKSGVIFANPTLDLDAIRSWKESVVSKLSKGIGQLAESRKVQVIQGFATFDSPTQLLVKLENMGITGGTLEIVQDFLSNRMMRVGVGDSFSELLRIVSGVPQGSVLGPILFLLFINDLPDHIKSRILLFADDLKLIANALHKAIVDEDLESLERWESLWCLRFNLDKCKVLHLSANDNPINSYIAII